MSEGKITTNIPKKAKRQRITAEAETNTSAPTATFGKTNTHVPKWKKFLSLKDHNKDNNKYNSNNVSSLSRSNNDNNFTEIADIESNEISEIDSPLVHENKNQPSLEKGNSLKKNKKKTEFKTVSDNEKLAEKEEHKDGADTQKSDTLSAELMTSGLKIPENASDSSKAALRYLATWYLHRQSVWKFQKVRQVWLLQHAYDIDNVPNEFFRIFLEYISDLTGKARGKTIKEAQEILEQFEK
ncbi:5539_t:CDS:2, partial [Ambispora leptoticha]